MKGNKFSWAFNSWGGVGGEVPCREGISKNNGWNRALMSIMKSISGLRIKVNYIRVLYFGVRCRTCFPHQITTNERDCRICWGEVLRQPWSFDNLAWRTFAVSLLSFLMALKWWEGLKIICFNSTKINCSIKERLRKLGKLCFRMAFREWHLEDPKI